jgi:hypothetical protein
MNLLEDNVETINRNRETLIVASKEVCLEETGGKPKYMLVSRRKKAGQIRYIKIRNKSMESVVESRYFGTTVTNQNFNQ